MKKIYIAPLIAGLMFSHNAYAWFFFFIPMPTGWPNGLHNQVKALAESNQTKALAYVGEDKTFGQKYYVWGYYIGDLNQKEAVKLALERCNKSLEKATNELLDGQPRWNFGDKKCELYGFPNLPETAIMPTPEELATGSISSGNLNSALEKISTPANPTPIRNTPATKIETKTPSALPIPQPSSNSEGAKKLIELKSLLDQGVITQQDFEAKKMQILKSM